VFVRGRGRTQDAGGPDEESRRARTLAQLR
jgi:hypothetical protein